MDAIARRSWIRAAAFPVLLALPLLSIPLGASDVPGVEPEPRVPPLSLGAWLDGSWQAGVERWFDRYFGLRRYWIRTANQIQFTVFREIPFREGHELVLGRGGSLFQAGYLKSVQGLDELAPARLEAFAIDLRRLQEHLRERGIPFLFLVTPSKASLQPEELPELSGPLRPVNVERLVPLLVKHGVSFLDGREVARELRDRTGRPVFPKGGIHSNQELALRTTQALIERLESGLGRRLVHLHYAEPVPMGAPRRPDTDLADLANLWWTGAFHRPVPQPVVTAHVPGEPIFRPRVYFIGGSFLDLPLKVLQAHGVIDASSMRSFYGRHRIEDASAGLAGWDAVVMETNEAAIPWLGFGFIEAVLGGEPPPRLH